QPGRDQWNDSGHVGHTFACYGGEYLVRVCALGNDEGTAGVESAQKSRASQVVVVPERQHGEEHGVIREPGDVGTHTRVVNVVVVSSWNQLRQRRCPARQQHRGDIRRIWSYALEETVV